MRKFCYWRKAKELNSKDSSEALFSEEILLRNFSCVFFVCFAVLNFLLVNFQGRLKENVSLLLCFSFLLKSALNFAALQRKSH